MIIREYSFNVGGCISDLVAHTYLDNGNGKFKVAVVQMMGGPCLTFADSSFSNIGQYCNMPYAPYIPLVLIPEFAETAKQKYCMPVFSLSNAVESIQFFNWPLNPSRSTIFKVKPVKGKPNSLLLSRGRNRHSVDFA